MRDLNDLSSTELWKVVLALTGAIIGLAFIVVGVCDHYETTYAARCERAGLHKVDLTHDFLCADPKGALFLPSKE
jgi:hypothetical protein